MGGNELPSAGGPSAKTTIARRYGRSCLIRPPARLRKSQVNSQSKPPSERGVAQDPGHGRPIGMEEKPVDHVDVAKPDDAPPAGRCGDFGQGLQPYDHRQQRPAAQAVLNQERIVQRIERQVGHPDRPFRTNVGQQRRHRVGRWFGRSIGRIQAGRKLCPVTALGDHDFRFGGAGRQLADQVRDAFLRRQEAEIAGASENVFEFGPGGHADFAPSVPVERHRFDPGAPAAISTDELGEHFVGQAIVGLPETAQPAADRTEADEMPNRIVPRRAPSDWRLRQP